MRNAKQDVLKYISSFTFLLIGIGIIVLLIWMKNNKGLRAGDTSQPASAPSCIFDNRQVESCKIYRRSNRSEFMIHSSKQLDELVTVINKFANATPLEDGVGVSGAPSYGIDLYGKDGSLIGELYMQEDSIINIANKGEKAKTYPWRLVVGGKELFDLLEKCNPDQHDTQNPVFQYSSGN